jgi:mitochondrial fission protein ELM1
MKEQPALETARPRPAPPTVWLLTGHKAGDNSQILALAEKLSWPFTVKKLVYRPTELLSNLLLGPTLAGIRRSRSSELAPPWPDLVITAGRRNEPVARWIQRRSGGHSRIVHVGRPWARPERFDLIITTVQYRVPPAANVLENLLPLHRISRDRLGRAEARWRDRLAPLSRPYTVVLLGGNSGPYCFTPDRAQQLAASVSRMAGQSGGALLVTSSARTPTGTLKAFERGLTAPHYVHHWQPNDPDNPYFAFLALADALVVTGESVSMLTEACMTGKPVYIYDLGDHPVPLPMDLSAREPVRPRRRPWWHFPENYRWKPLSHRLAMTLGPRRMRRDVGIIHRHLIEQGHATWLGQPFPSEGSPPPLADLERAAERVRSLFA